MDYICFDISECRRHEYHAILLYLISVFHLMSQGIKTTLDFLNVGKIINLPDGVAAQDAATVHQLATGMTTAGGTAMWGGIGGSISDQTDLISGGKILASLLPAIAITDTSVVASEAEMLAITAETGDICVRTDETKTYILKGTDPSVLADWEWLLTPTGGVVSVFGRSGAVTAQSGDYSFSLISGTAGPTQGGTGLTTYAKGDVLIATGTNTVGVVAASATDGYVFTWDAASGLPMWKAASGGGGGWSLTGNAGTTPGTDFIGTTDLKDLVFKANNTISGFINLDKFSVAWGAFAGNYTNVTGAGNTSFGYQSLAAVTTGANNLGFGTRSLQNNTTGGTNTAIGYEAMKANVSGTNNVGIGNSSLLTNTTSSNNTSIGFQALKLATGGQNIAIGSAAGDVLTTGTQNTFVGTNAGKSTTGNGNVSLGMFALGSVGSGSYNVAIGYSTGWNQTGGSYNILLGEGVQAPSLTGSSQLNIGNVIYGVGMYSSWQLVSTPTTNGQIAIGTATIPSCALLTLESTTKVFLPPRMALTEWNSIASKVEGSQAWNNTDHGQVWCDGSGTTMGFRYNRSTNKFQGFDGTNWLDLN